METLTEIEKIFGKPTKMSLFSDDEIAYEVFRQSIIDAPLCAYDKTKLPFDDINIVNFHIAKNGGDDILVHTSCRSERSKNELLRTLSRKSRIHKEVGVSEILPPLDRLNDNKCQQIHCYPKDEGKVSGRLFELIINPLLLYAKRRTDDVNKMSEQLFEQIINPLLSYAKKKNDDIDKHIFKLEKAGICKACGYYDFSANHFYIMKGSMFVKTYGKAYSASSSGATRKRLIEKSCTDMGKYYIVNNDFKCRTATSAASILMGKVSHYSYWFDDEGRCLADIFPTRFIIKNQNK